jgi:hypothetical protein
MVTQQMASTWWELRLVYRELMKNYIKNYWLLLFHFWENERKGFNSVLWTLGCRVQYLLQFKPGRYEVSTQGPCTSRSTR